LYTCDLLHNQIAKAVITVFFRHPELLRTSLQTPLLAFAED